MGDGVYVRGNRADRWEKLGAKGWKYEDVLPYFRKSEDYRDNDRDSGFHGDGGYLNVEKGSYVPLISNSFIQAGIELGYKELDYKLRKMLKMVFASPQPGPFCTQ